MKKTTLFFISLTLLFFSACNHTSNDPKATLSSFFDALSKKDFVTARKLSTVESKSMLDLMEAGMKTDNNSKESEEKYDKTKMEFGESKIEGDKAIVPVKEIKSGETMNFTLKKENGSWKVAFDKMTMMGMGMEKAGEKGFNISDSLNNVMEDLNDIGIDSLQKQMEESIKKLDSTAKHLHKMENE